MANGLDTYIRFIYTQQAKMGKLFTESEEKLKHQTLVVPHFHIVSFGCVLSFRNNNKHALQYTLAKQQHSDADKCRHILCFFVAFEMKTEKSIFMCIRLPFQLCAAFQSHTGSIFSILYLASAGKIVFLIRNRLQTTRKG